MDKELKVFFAAMAAWMLFVMLAASSVIFGVGRYVGVW